MKVELNTSELALIIEALHLGAQWHAGETHRWEKHKIKTPWMHGAIADHRQSREAIWDLRIKLRNL